MTIVSPNYQINSTALPSPTKAGWALPGIYGTDGNGQSRYEPFYEYELNWSLLTQAEYNSLYTLWLGAYGSGTSTCRLPTYNTTTYAFSNYTGVVFDMPTFGDYDTNYVAGVKMTIRKITV